MSVKKSGELMLMLPLFFVSCIYSFDGTVGTGNIVSEKIEVVSFTAVENLSSAKVEILKGDSFDVEFSDYENLLEHWDVKVVNNRLLIQTNPFTSLVNTKAKVRIVMPDQLEKLIVSGSGDIHIGSTFESIEKAIVSGSGSINSTSHTNYNYLDLVVSGSGNIRLDGAAEDLNATISGSGKIFLADVITKHADCLVSGSGDIYVTVENTLKAVISGSGNIVYSGNTVIDVTDNGSGKLIKD